MIQFLKEAIKVRRELTDTTLLFLLYILMFWADLPAYRPGMDSMTYGAIAKHMLATRDWAVPHYTTQAYANFFQHPPLAMWMMAATMKVFGTDGDWVLKILPAVMAGLCAIGVYLLGRRIRGESDFRLVGRNSIRLDR